MEASPPKEVQFVLEPIVERPRLHDDPLGTIYRAKSFDAVYKQDFLFFSTSKILSPSATKLLYLITPKRKTYNINLQLGYIWGVDQI